jgi:hypothetical protein
MCLNDILLLVIHAIAYLFLSEQRLLTFLLLHDQDQGIVNNVNVIMYIAPKGNIKWYEISAPRWLQS